MNLAHLWEINRYLCQIIQFADAKAGAIVGLMTLALGLLGGASEGLRSSPLFMASMAAAGVPIVLSIMVIRPRFLRSSSKGTIFWEHIVASGGSTEYEENVKRADPATEVLSQNFSLAVIAKRKYNWLRFAILAMILALLFLLVAFIITSSVSTPNYGHETPVVKAGGQFSSDCPRHSHTPRSSMELRTRSQSRSTKQIPS